MSQDGSAESSAGAPGDGFKYWAFISYSHRDSKWAAWLHGALEHYRVPARLVRGGGRPALPRRIYPVFRDREELASSSDLGATLRDALRGSRYLIVVCSPAAAGSRWVNEEIRAFKAMGGEDRVLCLIVQGEPGAQFEGSGGAAGAAEGRRGCFPEALCFRVTGEGQITPEPVEPMGADVRPGKDPRRAALLKLVAGILKVPLAELLQRDRRRRRRRMVLTVVAAAVVAACFGGLWGMKQAQLARQDAEAHARQAALETQKAEQARLDRVELEINQGREALDGGHADQALAWLADAYGLTSGRPGDRPLLRFLLARAAAPVAGREAAFSPNGGAIATMEFNADGSRVLSIGQDGFGRISDAATGKPLAVANESVYGRATENQVSADYSRAVTVEGGAGHGAAYCWDIASGRKVKLGGPDAAESAAISRDGTRALVKGTAKDFTGVLAMVDAQIGEPVATLGRFSGSPSQLFFTPDGRAAWIEQHGQGKANAFVWSGQDDPTGFEFRGSGSLEDVIFSSTGDRMIINPGGKLPVALCDAVHWKPIATLDKGGAGIDQLVFSPDGRKIAALCSSAGTARIWNADDGSLVADLGGKTSTAGGRHDLTEEIGGSYGSGGAAIFSPDGKRLIAANSGLGATVWDVASGKSVLKIRSGDTWLTGAVFSPEGDALMTVGKEVNVFDSASGRLLTTAGSMKEPVSAARFAPKGRLAVTDANGQVQVLRWKELRSPEAGRLAVGTVVRAKLSASGKWLITADGQISVKLWDLSTGTSRALPGPQGAVWAVAFCADEKLAATGGADGVVRLWKLEDGSLVFSKSVGDPGDFIPPTITALCFSADDRELASASGSGTQTKVIRWKVADGSAVSSVPLPVNFGCMRYSPDGGYLVGFASDGTGWCWPTGTDKAEVLTYHHAGLAGLEFTGNGKLLSAGSDGLATTWDLSRGGNKPLEARRDAGLSCLCLSPDRKLAALASAAGTVEFWDTGSGKLTHTLRVPAPPPDPTGLPRFDFGGHPQAPLVEAFSGDGSMFAAATEDGAVHIWDVAEPDRPLIAYEGLASPVGLVFSSAGDRLTAVDQAGAVVTWDVSRETRGAEDLAKDAEKTGWKVIDGELHAETSGGATASSPQRH